MTARAVVFGSVTHKGAYDNGPYGIARKKKGNIDKSNGVKMTNAQVRLDAFDLKE